jgi:hypothetical protein
MKLPGFITRWLIDRAVAVKLARQPDFIIGGADNPYLRRWYLTPWSNWPRGSQATGFMDRLRRRLPNVYLHEVLRSDDDRALHDHPWWNLSIILLGYYFEHTIAAGGVNRAATRISGDLKLRAPRAAHRLEVLEPCTTLFITGPKVRDWGFHCPQGWRPWQQFVAADNPGKPGRGCA